MKINRIAYILILLFCSVIILRGQICFGPVSNYSADTTPYGIFSADFNGDGNLDLASANSGTNTITVLLGNGTGSFTFSGTFIVGQRPMSLTCADFNGDGKIDIATSNSWSDNVSILIGNGSGNFSNAVNYPVGTYPSFVHSTDLNNDGKIDLITANQISIDVSVLLGNGLGNFSTPNNFPVASLPNSVYSADFNNDGNIDVVSANVSSGNVTVLFGNGLGSLSSATNFGTGAQPEGVYCTDLNNDLNADIICSNYISNNISVLLGNGSGSFVTTNYPVGTGPYSIHSADFNNDGIVDLSTANLGSSDVSLLLGTGSGNFLSALSFSIGPGTGPISVFNADFNNDSKIDIATANSSLTNVSVILNTSPYISINASSNPVCVGHTVTLNGIGANTYSWTGGISNGVPFSPTVTTQYMVTGTNTLTNCSSSAFITLSVSACTGINENNNEAETLSIYPNPFLNEVKILSLSVVESVEIYSSLGLLIFSSTKLSDNISLELKDLLKGIYFIKIKTSGKDIIRKILKD